MIQNHIKLFSSHGVIAKLLLFLPTIVCPSIQAKDEVYALWAYMAYGSSSLRPSCIDHCPRAVVAYFFYSLEI